MLPEEFGGPWQDITPSDRDRALEDWRSLKPTVGPEKRSRPDDDTRSRETQPGSQASIFLGTAVLVAGGYHLVVGQPQPQRRRQWLTRRIPNP
jgi:hypothetical protein